MQRGDSAEEGHRVEMPPELPGATPAEPWRGSAAWAWAVQLALGTSSRWCVCWAVWGAGAVHVHVLGGAFTGTQPPAPPVLFRCGRGGCVLLSRVPLPTFRGGARQRRGALPSVFSAGLVLGATSASGGFQAEPFTRSLSQPGHLGAQITVRGIVGFLQGRVVLTCSQSRPAWVHAPLGPEAGLSHGNAHPPARLLVWLAGALQGLHPAELATRAPGDVLVCVPALPAPTPAPLELAPRKGSSVRTVPGGVLRLSPASACPRPVGLACARSQGQGPALSVSLSRDALCRPATSPSPSLRLSPRREQAARCEDASTPAQPVCAPRGCTAFPRG